MSSKQRKIIRQVKVLGEKSETKEKSGLCIAAVNAIQKPFTYNSQYVDTVICRDFGNCLCISLR